MDKQISVKRIYEKYDKTDGKRILVDRLWPRGIKKEDAKIDFWLKEIAPSNELRKWYSHDPAKWDDFRKKYFMELNGKEELCEQLLSKGEKITLLFSSKELRINNAAALKEYLERNF